MLILLTFPRKTLESELEFSRNLSWRSKFGEMDASTAQRLQSMEDGIRRLKRLVAD